MKKAIFIEEPKKTVSRVLSIADVSAVENSPNGLTYIGIDNFVEPPVLDNPLDKCYPMYNTETGLFYWVVVEYQFTAPEGLIDSEVLKHETQEIKAVNVAQQEIIDLQTELLADILGGAI